MTTQPPETPPTRPRRRPELWVYLAFALALLQAALRLTPELRPGPAGVYCWDAGMELGPLAAVGLGLFGVLASWAHRPFWRRWRVVGFLTVAAVVASSWTFVTYPSSHDGRPSRVAFRLPLDGPVTVAWGGPTADVNYHVVAPEQRWAYDLLVTRDGRSHKGDGRSLDDYYAYGLPVLAPADGVVVETFDTDPDMPPGQLGGGTTASGNFVAIEVAPSEYLWLCHLQPGSITVTSGDHVAQGQAIARVGNSGNTSEPHLHVQLQDSNDPDFSEGIPLEFHHYTVNGRFVAHGIPAGGIRDDGTFAGQVVENVPAETKPETRNVPSSPQ